MADDSAFADERARRRSILGIDLLEQAAAEQQGAAPAAKQQAAAFDDEVPKAQATQDNITPSTHFGALQAVVDELFEDRPDEHTVRRLDVVLAAESSDLPADLLEVVGVLPPGTYSRKRLCTQLNSALSGRALGQVYGTVV